jgi:hypothetical protein
MWKQRSAELHKWLKTTPPASIGAKLFLQTRFGVRSAVAIRARAKLRLGVR